MLGISDILPAKTTWNYKKGPRGWDTEVHIDGGRKPKVLGMGQKWN